MRAHKKTKSTAWKAQENVNHQLAIVLVLNLIGCKGGENCPDQSQNAVEQNQSNSSFLSTLDWKLLKYGKNPLCTWFSFAQDYLYWTYKWYNTITLVIMLRFDDVRFDLTSNWSKYKWLYYHWWDQTWRLFWPIRDGSTDSHLKQLLGTTYLHMVYGRQRNLWWLDLSNPFPAKVCFLLMFRVLSLLWRCLWSRNISGRQIPPAFLLQTERQFFWSVPPVSKNKTTRETTSVVCKRISKWKQGEVTVLFSVGGRTADPKSVRRCKWLSQRPKQRSRPKNTTDCINSEKRI